MLVMEVDEIGASVRFTTVTINAKRPAQSAPADNGAWNTDAPAGKSTGDEPPF